MQFSTVLGPIISIIECIMAQQPMQQSHQSGKRESSESAMDKTLLAQSKQNQDNSNMKFNTDILQHLGHQ